MGTPITIPVLNLPIPSRFFGIWGLSGFNIIILPSGRGVLFRNLLVHSEQFVNISLKIKEIQNF